MNEADTRAELIEPALKASGWGVVESKYIETGVEELDQEKLPDLLKLKYHEISDAAEILGGTDRIRQTFIAFQKYLYEKAA